jgi:hypothetical protein
MHGMNRASSWRYYDLTKDASRMKMKMAGAIGKLSVGVAATL